MARCICASSAYNGCCSCMIAFPRLRQLSIWQAQYIQGADGIRARFSNCNISEVIQSIVANFCCHSSVTDCALLSCKIRSPRRSSTSKSVEEAWALLFVRAGRLSKAILKFFHIRYDQHDESCRTSGSVWKIPVLILRLHQKAKVKNNSLTTSFHQVHCPQQ